MRRWVFLLLIALAVSSLAPAYFHFIHYQHQEGRYVSIPRKFDLSALPNRTVSYFIHGTPAQFAEEDSFPALVSQIQLAARQWNDVDTSALRVQFGGFATEKEGQSTPAIDILFAEIPPGVIAYGGPTQPTNLDLSADGQFYPITRSQVVLPVNMEEFSSFEESFFLTIVHELGHALGLQHTLTNSVMSTSLTRSQSKASTLGPDDIAGISLLYPTPAFRTSLGTVTGRVAAGENGVPLSSVVAISKRGYAISALTAPDGTYQIQGIPPGDYAFYVNPLPPPQFGEETPANIQFPLGLDGNHVQPAPSFDVLFWPGTRNHAEAQFLPVTASASLDGVDFHVSYRAEPLKLYNTLTYSFPGSVAVRPAHVNLNGNRHFIVATGKGLMHEDQPFPGLQAGVLGNDTGVSSISRYFTDYIQLDLQYTESTTPGKKHLVFSTGSEVYVSPGSLTLTTNQPPHLTEVTALENQDLQLQGENISAGTIVFFDGVPATVRSHQEEGEETARLIVTPPPAPHGHRSRIVAYNGDGQNSLFLDGEKPLAFELAASEVQPSLLIHPQVLHQGDSRFLEIHGTNTNFREGQVSVGFGTSDIVVKKLWVRSATHIIMQVYVSPQAELAFLDVTLTNGLQQIHQPVSMRIDPYQPDRITVQFPEANPFTGIGHAVAGGTLLVVLNDLQGETPVFFIGDQNSPAMIQNFERLESGAYALQIPADLAPGPVSLAVHAGNRTSDWQLIEIELPAPEISFWQPEEPDIVSLEEEKSRSIEPYPAKPGETITLLLTGELKPIAPFQKVWVTVRVGEVEHLASLQGNRVSFTLLPSVVEGEYPLSLYLDGRLMGTLPLVVVGQ